jgi:hypothetical protein
MGNWVEPSKIEIIAGVDGLNFQESFAKRVHFKMEKLNVPYMDFEDLIRKA